MNNRFIRPIFSIGILMLMILACTLPASNVPTPVLFPTPDLTLTALFAPIQVTPSAMPQGVKESPTSPPVADLPTSTILPTAAPTAEASPSPIAPTVTDTLVPATSTAIPTSTEVSYFGPAARSNPRLRAVYLQDEPNIDGVFDEWGLDRYEVGSVVYGLDKWSGSADLSGSLMVGWDDYYLYIAVRVRDDRYVQNASGEYLFKGDSVELLLDTNVSSDFYLASLSYDDYQLGISPGQATVGSDLEAYLWYPRSVSGERSTVKAAATATDNGYRLEAKIPWSLYGITPNIGQHYGFAFSLSDNDNASNNVQQSMVSTSPGRKLTDPTTWGDLYLDGR